MWWCEARDALPRPGLPWPYASCVCCEATASVVGA
ncbi:hypothetical protein E2C01_027947 [Portunus trituberculatus]|uniref:Uncharacterized protein n=1 Tax=Portunus trituberculatus TaxID=210409 RepID=A0A5B7EQA5_PORTR|nr:hypothetical protein [Portunus trituberculatus]